jgi:hypothetical protein
MKLYIKLFIIFFLICPHSMFARRMAMRMYGDSTPEVRWRQTERKKAEVEDMMMELERAKPKQPSVPSKPAYLPNPIMPKSEPVKQPIANRDDKVIARKPLTIKQYDSFYAQLDSLLANAKNDAVVENSVTNFIANGDKSAQERLFDILQNNEKTKQYFDNYDNQNIYVAKPATSWLSLIASCLIGIVGTVLFTKLYNHKFPNE